MRIGLLTYDRPHKKTYDLACLLKVYGYDVTLILTDWVDRKERHPLVQHRPVGYAPRPEVIADRFNFVICKRDDTCDEYIIGGANIVKGLKAINSHPGYLPVARGLDSLKWAIYHGLPVGVTTHYTIDEADSGKMIKRQIVPLYYEDTFHSFAYRSYDLEIQMLVDSIGCNEIVDPDDTVQIGNVSRRMPPYLERVMLERFENRRKNSTSQYE